MRILPEDVPRGRHVCRKRHAWWSRGRRVLTAAVRAARRVAPSVQTASNSLARLPSTPLARSRAWTHAPAHAIHPLDHLSPGATSVNVSARSRARVATTARSSSKSHGRARARPRAAERDGAHCAAQERFAREVRPMHQGLRIPGCRQSRKGPLRTHAARPRLPR